jgi:hypothetical protein
MPGIINSYRFAGATGLDLDNYSGLGLEVAFSLRRLSTSYSGNCIKVRRSSDNATQNIGFTGGLGTWVDDSAISTFIGGGTGYIDTWYDQSGNGYDVSQATLTEQPVLIADVFSLTGGTAYSLSFAGTNDNLYHDAGSDILTSKKEFTALVALRDAGGGFASSFSFNRSITTSVQWSYKVYSYSASSRLFQESTNNSIAPTAGARLEHRLDYWDGSDIYQDLDNGTTTGTSASTGAAYATQYFIMGASTADTPLHPWTGQIGEFIFFTTNIATGDKDDIRTDQNDIYRLY